MRAIAARHHTGTFVTNEKGEPIEIVHALPARITVHPPRDGQGRYNTHFDGQINVFSSLHRAKNAIRRHFSISSRKALRWIEETR